MNQIKSNWFLTDFYQTRCKTFFWIGSETDFELALIRSNWIPIQNEQTNKSERIRAISRYSKIGFKTIRENS